jgi:hypothetical protein
MNCPYRHNAMPLKKDPMWAHFTKFEEDYKETPNGESKIRLKGGRGVGEDRSGSARHLCGVA